jgi:hypothetical protein
MYHLEIKVLFMMNFRADDVQEMNASTKFNFF